MKIIRNNLIPLPGFAAINLFGLLFVRRGAGVDRTLLNHERIHSRQQRELLYLPFYVVYVVEWLVRLFTHRFRAKEAYRAISFEREAYANQADSGYCSRRRLYAQWRKPVKIK